MTTNMTETEKRNVETITRLVKGFASGNTAQIDKLVHPDFVNHHAPEGLRDRAGFHEIVKQVHSAFSSFDEFALEPTHVFSKGDYVAMMDQGGGKRKGKPYTHVDIHIFIMKDGMMFQHWNSFGLPCQRDILMNLMAE